jgi:hypothetical protein
MQYRAFAIVEYQVVEIDRSRRKWLAGAKSRRDCNEMEVGADLHRIAVGRRPDVSGGTAVGAIRVGDIQSDVAKLTQRDPDRD